MLIQLKNYLFRITEYFKEKTKKIRENFCCDNEIDGLKNWEFLLLTIGGYLKETIEIIISSSSSKKQIKEYCSAFPMNSDLFWVAILRILPAIMILSYLWKKYSQQWIIWYVVIYWSWSIGTKILDVLPVNIAIEIISFSLKVILYSCLFAFFFTIEKTNLDSLKLLIYDDLEIDYEKNRIYKMPWSRVSKKKISTTLIIISTIVIAGILMCHWVDSLIKNMPLQSTSNQQKLNEMAKKNLIYLAIASIVIAPVTEELVFRRCLMKMGNYQWWTVIVSAFIFGILHLESGETLKKITPYFIPGLFLAMMLKWSRNIWHSILAHSLHNTVTMMIMIVNMKNGNSATINL